MYVIFVDFSKVSVTMTATESSSEFTTSILEMFLSFNYFQSIFSLHFLKVILNNPATMSLIQLIAQISKNVTESCATSPASSISETVVFYVQQSEMNSQKEKQLMDLIGFFQFTPNLKAVFILDFHWPHNAQVSMPENVRVMSCPSLLKSFSSFLFKAQVQRREQDTSLQPDSPLLETCCVDRFVKYLSEEHVLFCKTVI